MSLHVLNDGTCVRCGATDESQPCEPLPDVPVTVELSRAEHRARLLAAKRTGNAAAVAAVLAELGPFVPR